MQATRRLLGGPLLLDALLALGAGGFALLVTPWVGGWQAQVRRPVDALGMTLIAAAAAPLAVRRIWPLPALALTVAALIAYLTAGYVFGPIFLALVVAMYTVGTSLSLRHSLAAAGVATLALCLPQAIAAAGHPLVAAQSVAWAAAWLLMPWAVGALVRFQRTTTARDREADARRLAYEQRLEVAREVHDVVGHGLSVINMQAGVALHVLDRRPEQAKVALEAIRLASKESLDELRATLTVFRQREGGRRIEPGLSQLDGLVSAMAERGLPVELVINGEASGLPAAVDLAAYRIVQESLTNVVRHAGASHAIVRIERGDDDVVVEVTDDGQARAGAGRRLSPAGHGITGMRERTAALGGELTAGPQPEGGFRVLARLPAAAAP